MIEIPCWCHRQDLRKCLEIRWSIAKHFLKVRQVMTGPSIEIVFLCGKTTEVSGKQMVNGLHSTLKIIFGFPPWPKRAGLEESPRACAWSCKRPAKLSPLAAVSYYQFSIRRLRMSRLKVATLRLQPQKADGGCWTCASKDVLVQDFSSLDLYTSWECTGAG